MSNTSDQTTKPSKTTRLIVGEVGVDTETGIVGKGHSYDNGKTFVVDDTIYGRIYHADDHSKIWKGIQDQVVKVVNPAKSAADSAQSAADAAVASAQVTSDAVSAIASATAEAKQGANEAMSRALSAWDVATGAKEAVTDFDPLLKSAQSDAGKALTQIADTASALSDAKTAFGSDVATAKNLASTAQTTANSAVAVASDARSNATVAIQTASGASLTAIDAKGDATIAKQTASEATFQASNAESDFAQLSIRANKIEATLATNSGAIASVQQTANGLTTTVADIKANGGGVNLASGTTSEDQTWGDASQTTGWVVPKIAIFDNPQAGQQYTISVNTRTNGGTWEIQVWDGAGPDQRVNWLIHGNTFSTSTQEQKQIATFTWPSGSNKYLIAYLANSNDGGQIVWNSAMIEEGAVAHTWSPAPDDLQNQFTQIKASIDGVTTTINDPKTGLNATYQTAAGNATTISNVKGDVTQLQTTANGLTSRVGSLESKTDTQQTAIDQNKAAIALKADQTAVDTLKGTVNQNTATLKTQADQIQSKVSASDVSGMLTSYATQTYTQSLVTQKADQWNLNLTSLQTDVNAIKTTGGGVNLLTGTAKCEFPFSTNGGAQTVQKYDDETNYIQHTSNTPIDYMGPWWPLTPEVGQVYTLSADVSGNGYIQSFHYEGGDNGSLGQVNLTNNWQRISNTFRVNTISGNWDIYASNSTLLKIKNIKIEKGTVAHDWSPAPSDMATVTSVANLSATVDGIKSTVATKADQSTVTELSNLIQSKVSSSDYTSEINQLSNDINLRVKSTDLISQINLQAGAASIQSDKIVLDGNTTVITGDTFIPSAAISSISADKIKIGNTSLFGSDGTFNLINGSGSTASSSIKLTTGIMEGVSQPLTQLSNGTNTHALEVGEEGINVTPTIFFNDYPDEAKDTGWLGFSRHQAAELYFHTYDDTKELFRIACTARVNHDLHVDGTLWQQGLSITSGNTIWSGSDYLAIGDHISNTYTNVMARAFSSQSTLSSKTNIETVDPKDALDLVNRTDIRSYQYTADVAQGKTKRYTSLIIDDVNDVSQYYAPNEFTNEERTGRDDGSAVGYLFLAVKELTRRIKALEEKLNG